MKKILFYQFSSTGNTLLVLRAMQEVFEGEGIEVEVGPIQGASVRGIEAGVTLGLAFPVAMQGTFPFIWDFVKSLPQGKNDVFMVDTMMLYSGGVVGPLRTILRRKGYHTIGAREIMMPVNIYRRSIRDQKDEQKRQKGLIQARQYARDLIDQTARWRRIPVLSDLMSLFSRARVFQRLYRWASPIRLDQLKCTKCGICVKICPVQNFTIPDYPVPGNKCELCVRCVSYCPEQALSLGNYGLQYKAVKLKDIIRGL